MPQEPQYALEWDKSGERFYETGISNGVLYPQASNGTYPEGVAWNGLTALYADNIKYLNLISAEEFGATVEAYTYPDEFAQCNGEASLNTGVTIGQQIRKAFGLCYQTKIGNDVDANDHGYKIHIIYGCLAAPSERAYSTINDSPEAITFSWEITTTPVNVTGFKPTACLIIDSTKASETKLARLKAILYGTPASDGQAAVDPRLPLPDEIATIFNAAG